MTICRFFFARGAAWPVALALALHGERSHARVVPNNGIARDFTLTDRATGGPSD